MSCDDERLARRLQMEEESLSCYGDNRARRCSEHGQQLSDTDVARFYNSLYLAEQQVTDHRYSQSDSDSGVPGDGYELPVDRYRASSSNMGEFASEYHARAPQMESRHHQTRSLTLGGSRDQQQPAGFESRTLRIGGMPDSRTNNGYTDTMRSHELHLRLQSLEQDVARQSRRPSDIEYSVNNRRVRSPRIRNGSFDDQVNDPQGLSLPANPDLEYARRLQEIAFSDLQRQNPTNYNSMPRNATRSSSFDRRSSSHAVEPDEELARRMQELEDQGPGGIDYDDDSSDSDSESDNQKVPLPGQVYRMNSSFLSESSERSDAKLAKFMQEAGASFADISPDILSDVLSSESSHGSLSRIDTLKKVPSRLYTGQIPTVPTKLPSNCNLDPSSRKKDESSDSDSEEEDRKFTLPGQLYGMNSAVNKSSEKKDEKLARFMQETDSSFSQIRPDVLLDVLGPDSLHSSVRADPLGAAPPSRQSVNQPHSVPDNKSPFKAADVPQSSQGMALLNDTGVGNSPGCSPVHEPKAVDLRIERCQVSPDMEAPLADASIRKKRGFLGFGKKSSGKKEITSSTTPGVLSTSPTRSPRKAGGRKVVSSLLYGMSPKPTSPTWNRSASAGVFSSVLPPGIVPPRGVLPPPVPGSAIPMNIPRGIPPPPPGPPPGSHPSFGLAASQPINGFVRVTTIKPKSTCAACGLSHGSFLQALDKKYHAECFRCFVCNGKIDPNSQFKFSSDPFGQKHAHHVECSVRLNGIKCIVCRKAIPASYDRKIAFVKHPFFSNEHMCVHHAEVPHRRCSGCQRFEPQDKPFIDLMDGNRCVCPACCRTVIFDSPDVEPLWKQVIYFLEFKLKLPVWDQMKEIPILLVGSDELASQMRAERSLHAHSSQIMTSGLCLTGAENGEKTSVVAILCLSGLPRDLTLSILSREATLAWFKLHPKYDWNNPFPVQVEEGIAQLIAFLFLSEAMSSSTNGDVCPLVDDGDGPSDEKLRQYFKFTIERESHEVYGTGYRKAAVAYRDVGIEELLDYAVKYRDFPRTQT